MTGFRGNDCLSAFAQSHSMRVQGIAVPKCCGLWAKKLKNRLFNKLCGKNKDLWIPAFAGARKSGGLSGKLTGMTWFTGMADGASKETGLWAKKLKNRLCKSRGDKALCQKAFWAFSAGPPQIFAKKPLFFNNYVCLKTIKGIGPLL